MITPTSLDHLVFRVASIPATERFYTALLGAPAHATDAFLVYTVGLTRLFFTLAPSQPEAFDKDKIGLNHLAFSTQTLAELETIATQLTASGIEHSGIKLDPHGQKNYIWLNDPDGFRVEFYLRAE
jgi:glyoxylase I family protein